MDNQQERYCNNCGRFYSLEDWEEANCPFCDVPLEAVGVANSGPLLDDTISTEIPWPQGESEAIVFRASGYLDAQMVKAQLEAAGIPVLLQGTPSMGLSVGLLGAVPVMVPKSRREEALDILENND